MKKMFFSSKGPPLDWSAQKTENWPEGVYLKIKVGYHLNQKMLIYVLGKSGWLVTFNSNSVDLSQFYYVRRIEEKARQVFIDTVRANKEMHNKEDC